MDDQHDVDKTLRAQPVTIRCTDGSIIKGKVNLKHENRVSDLFTKIEEPFIVVFDVVAQGQKGPAIAINKQIIAWVLLGD